MRATVCGILMLAAGLASRGALGAEGPMYTITLDAVENGAITIEPALPESRQVAAGTELTINAKPPGN